MTMESAAIGQKTVSEARETVTGTAQAIDNQIGRIVEMAHRVQNLADRIEGGVPSGVGQNQQVVGAEAQTPPVLSMMRESRDRLANELDELQQQIDRIENAL